MLLNENDTDDVLFIQEPWFGRIGTKRLDTEAQGKQVMGGAANPRWALHYPHFPSTKRAKVMTYIRIHVLRYCRNVRPTWVKFDSKDTKESGSGSRLRVLSPRRGLR